MEDILNPSTIIVALGAIIVWMIQRWFEYRKDKDKWLEKTKEAEASQDSVILQRLTALEVAKATADDKFRDGLLSFKDSRDRLDYLERNKVSRMEFEAFMAQNEATHQAIKEVLTKLENTFHDISENMRDNNVKFDTNVRTMTELMSKLVTLGEIKA